MQQSQQEKIAVAEMLSGLQTRSQQVINETINLREQSKVLRMLSQANRSKSAGTRTNSSLIRQASREMAKLRTPVQRQ